MPSSSSSFATEADRLGWLTWQLRGAAEVALVGCRDDVAQLGEVTIYP